MIGSASRRQGRKTGLNPPTNSSDYYYGERATCDICEVEQQCFDRFGMVTCQACQSEFLPAGGGVLYFG
ncbi:hypothetical protein [Haloarcula onubensis]|uniref:Uncharacterized protein n=1 Tax=Haloarcula onubensis TaxID=2950539 RepID=A0ABU2FKW6_9EURY|nr:hypothetical protein [Halomicroarcula sp. S3CR25-11]MDS0281373.1 hypothetical protein [Halomicroarcula sp. S3CR25-11]